MKRPQSAKQARNYFAPSSNDDNGTEEFSRPFLKGVKKIHNVLTASNDISRMLPKRIQQDKQRLYCETLQLKSNLNEMQEQNHRLKTKIATLQKEKERLNRTEQPTLGKGKSTNMLSVGNKMDKQNGIVTNLKKIVRDTRDQNDELKKEIAKLKRTVRYTKVVEIELEKQTIYDENKRLARMIQQLEGQLQSRIEQDEELKNLQYQIAVRQKQLKEVTTDNIKYEELLEDTELKFKQVSQKLVIKEKKWQRDLAVEKRKVEQLTRQVDVLRQQVKILHEKMEEQKKKLNQAKAARPASSHPYQAGSNTNIKSKINKEKEEELNRNKKLKEQLQNAKRRLIESENRLKVTDNIPFQYSKDQTFELVLTKNEVNQFAKSKDDEYEDDFQNSPEKPSKGINQLPLQQKTKKNPKSKSVGKGKGKKVELTDLQNEIKDILTYRMKYNRFTFGQLKQEILNSPTTDFSFEDLILMFKGEPFFLTDEHVEQFLQFCYGRTAIKNDDQLEAKRLVQCLRIFIDDFQLLEEAEQEQMLYKIADFMTKHRDELEKQFQRAGGKNNLLNKQQIVSVLRSYRELSEEEISLVICYISANIQTLRSINFIELLDRFYIHSSKQISRDQLRLHSQEDELSLGQNEDLDEGQLIADDELV